MAKKAATELKPNQVRVSSENENKELVVDATDFFNEYNYFTNCGNITWDWKVIEQGTDVVVPKFYKN